MITTATHAEYIARKADWQLIHAMTTGEGVSGHLNKRYFEAEAHFKDRKASADFTPLTRYLISRLVGILFQREQEVERDAGNLSEEDLGTAGPRGEHYRVQLMELADTLIAYDTAYVIMNPRRGLEIASPLHVPNWTGQEIVVRGTRTTGSSVFSDVEQIDTWTRYMPAGYEVYRQVKGDDGKAQDELIESGLWAETEDGEENAYFVRPTWSKAAGEPMPPVIRIDMPWEARFGLLLAKKHRAIYEMESRRDFAASAAMNGLVQIGVGDNSDLADQITKKAKRGAKMLPYNKDYGEHKGLEIPTSGAELGSQIIEDKTKALRKVAYDTLEQAARQSATEAVIQHQGGAAAALSIVAETLSDAEMRILHLWNQQKDLRNAGPNPQPIDVRAEWPADYSQLQGLSD